MTVRLRSRAGPEAVNAIMRGFDADRVIGIGKKRK